MVMFEYRTGWYVMVHIGVFFAMLALSIVGFLAIVFWFVEHVRIV